MAHVVLGALLEQPLQRILVVMHQHRHHVHLTAAVRRVLAEEVGSATRLQSALQAFQERRWERCRMVVENSVRLGEIEASGGDPQEHSNIMRDSLMVLAAPI